MARYTIRTFLGVAPNEEKASTSTATLAELAENVDLSNGVCKPSKADLVVENGHSGPYITMYRGDIKSGVDSPLSMYAGDKEALIYRRLGQWKKLIGDSEVSLGISRPDAPKLAYLGLSIPSGANVEGHAGTYASSYLEDKVYTYQITFSILNPTGETEGKATLPIAAPNWHGGTEVVNPEHYNVITRPTNIPTRATHWNIYRSDDGSTPQLLQTCSVNGAGEGVSSVTDTKPMSALGRFLGEASNQTDENYRLFYVITYDRDTEGWIDESGPSYPIEIVCHEPSVRVTRPVSIPAGVKTWNIYRVSSDYRPTTDYELVSRVDASETYFDDYLDNESLGDVITTSYAAPNGLVVQAGPPPVNFDGVVGPHNGMLFGWKGGEIYYTEPGLADYWNDIYKLEAKSEVVGCIPTGYGLAVIQKRGMQLLTGTQPLNMFVSESLSGYGGVSWKAIAWGKTGLFYLSRGGIITVGEGGATSNLTESTLGTEFFEDYDFATAVLEVVHEKLYLSNSQQTVVIDVNRGYITTRSVSYEDLFMDREGGRLLGLKSNGAVTSVAGHSLEMPYTYKTGDLVLGNPRAKRFNQFEFFGEGVIDVTVFIDDVEVASRTLDMGQMRRHRRIKVPRKYQGRSANLQWVGSAKVKEISMEVDLAPIQVENS